MPTYQFKCKKCNKSFELIATLAEYEAKKFSCPHCNSKTVEQELFTFAPNTSKHVVR